MINDLNYEGIKFPVSRRDYYKIEKKNNICINVFCYEIDLTYPDSVSNRKFKKCMDLLLMLNENKRHYVYIKDFNRFICNTTKHKNKEHFCKCCLQCFSSEKVLIINDKQTVKLKSGSIRFRSYFKQLAAPFKIHSDFKCHLKGVKSIDTNNTSYTGKYQDHILYNFV